jgi:hypothetical protein
MEKEESEFEDKHGCKITVKLEKLYIKVKKKITDININELKKSFRLRMQDNTEDQLREQTNNVGDTAENLLLENINLGEYTRQRVAGKKRSRKSLK